MLTSSARGKWQRHDPHWGAVVGGPPPNMLRVFSAWHLLMRRTGGQCSKSTFYRWLQSGRIQHIRLGHQLFIPFEELDRAVKRCRLGEWL